MSRYAKLKRDRYLGIIEDVNTPLEVINEDANTFTVLGFKDKNQTWTLLKHDENFEYVIVPNNISEIHPRGKYPKVTENENLAYFDVDETLVHWIKDPEERLSKGETIITANYAGSVVTLIENLNHTNFLRSLKSRGFHIIVHSGNGWAWAKQVVELLELQEYVDEVKTKPAKIIDDSDYFNWMPARIYIDNP